MKTLEDYERRDYSTPKYLRTLRASDIKIKVTEWILPDFLPLGELTVLAGPKVTGKSTIYCAMAAAVSRGCGSHDSWMGVLNNEPRGVLIISSEDDKTRTITPRLIAAKANLDHIHFIEGLVKPGIDSMDYTFNSDDDDYIINTVQRFQIDLIIIDPWSLVISGDAKNGTKVQRKLEKLSELARTLNAAILLIAHVSKNSKGRDPVNRVAGTAALTDVARGIYITAKIEKESKDGSSHVLVRSASNLRKVGGGLSYSIESIEVFQSGVSVETSKIVWHSELKGSPEDILNIAEDTKRVKVSAFDKAKAFLLKFLSEGTRTYPEILYEANKIGISNGSLQRAKTDLDMVVNKKRNMGSNSPFEWTLPSSVLVRKYGADEVDGSNSEN